MLAPAPWELQPPQQHPSLAEQEGNLLVGDTPATYIREDTARVAARLHKPDIGTSAPRKAEVRRRAKTADLQLPSSQISQIILWTKQHILWMVSSLADHLPAEAVAAFPKPTRNELYGYVYSLFIDPQNPNSWVDSLSNDFDDMLLLQVWQYKTFQNFFDWIQISTVLFSLREETNFPLSPIQKRRLWTRYTGLFREDINIINLGEEGELRRYVTWKWQLERSDRSKSPSASYDFDPAIHEIDFLVWLDSITYNPAGHLGLDTIAVYSEGNVDDQQEGFSGRQVHARDSSAQPSASRDLAASRERVREVALELDLPSIEEVVHSEPRDCVRLAGGLGRHEQHEARSAGRVGLLVDLGAAPNRALPHHEALAAQLARAQRQHSLRTEVPRGV